MINSTIVNDRPRREAEAMETFLESPNEESFTELFLTLTPQLVSFYRSHGCGMDMSEDLSQEVMLIYIGTRGSSAIERDSVPGYLQLHVTRCTAITGNTSLKCSRLGPQLSNSIIG
jgi:hypothetical protein